MDVIHSPLGLLSISLLQVLTSTTHACFVSHGYTAVVQYSLILTYSISVGGSRLGSSPPLVQLPIQTAFKIIPMPKINGCADPRPSLESNQDFLKKGNYDGQRFSGRTDVFFTSPTSLQESWHKSAGEIACYRSCWKTNGYTAEARESAVLHHTSRFPDNDREGWTHKTQSRETRRARRARRRKERRTHGREQAQAEEWEDKQPKIKTRMGWEDGAASSLARARFWENAKKACPAGAAGLVHSAMTRNSLMPHNLGGTPHLTLALPTTLSRHTQLFPQTIPSKTESPSADKTRNLDDDACKKIARRRGENKRAHLPSTCPCTRRAVASTTCCGCRRVPASLEDI
ncbi:hypothetical protein C8R45DRAFT_933412 [Mycena sanguinolenta]|nr:hypothetical protein C8R45DRAFT_933412 [Mycena sanguinolenta]